MSFNRSRNRSRSGVISVNPLKSLSMFDDLYIFEPKNAVGSDLTIADTVGSAVVMQQTTAAQRPIIDGKVFNSSNNKNDSRGLQTDQDITFKELFVFAQYTRSTFDGFSTIASGSGSSGALRVMGTSGAKTLNTFNAINGSGLVRINNATETSTLSLPLSFSVLHTCTDFTTPADITDTYTIGYNAASLDREWLGNVGAMIFSRITLNDTQRQEIVDTLNQYHGI